MLSECGCGILELLSFSLEDEFRAEDWFIYIVHKLSRADFCIIVLVLAMFNVTWILLPFAAIGAQFYWITDLFDRARGYHT